MVNYSCLGLHFKNDERTLRQDLLVCQQHGLILPASWEGAIVDPYDAAQRLDWISECRADAASVDFCKSLHGLDHDFECDIALSACQQSISHKGHGRGWENP